MYICTYIWTRERRTHTSCVQQVTRSSCAPAHDAETRQNMLTSTKERKKNSKLYQNNTHQISQNTSYSEMGL